MWLALTLLSAFLWGIGHVLTKKGYDHVTPLFNNIFASIVTLAITVPFAISNGGNLKPVFDILPITLLIALLLLSFYYILELGQVSLTGTILATFPIYTVVLSILFLKEEPTQFQFIAMTLVLLGTIAIAFGEGISDRRKIQFGTWLWIAVAGSIMVGAADFFAKVAINQSDTYSYILIYGLTFPFISFLSYFFDKKGRKMPNLRSKKFLPTAIGVTMMEVGLLSFYVALSDGLVSVVTPISSLYVAIMTILAWFFLKEKLNRYQIVGIVLSLIGIMIL